MTAEIGAGKNASPFHLAKLSMTVADTRDNPNSLNRKYGRHIVPHDAQVREFGTGKTRVETAAALGLRFEVLPPARLEDGINAARMTFPRCYFDEVRCGAGIDALQNYRWDFNQRLDEFKTVPVDHDWASHGADAFRYLCMGIKQAPKAQQLTYSDQGIV